MDDVDPQIPDPWGTILQSGSIASLRIAPNVNNGVLLWLEGPADTGYIIQTSVDLISWRSLTNLTSDLTGKATADVPSTASHDAFYRAMTP